jgi:hypothetical protein
LTETNLVAYIRSKLYAFNGYSTKPWGYVNFMATFYQGEARRTMRVQFLVIDCKSLYNCIIRRATLAELGTTSSTANIKMTNHGKDDTIATLHANKNHRSVCLPKTPPREKRKRLL